MEQIADTIFDHGHGVYTLEETGAVVTLSEGKREDFGDEIHDIKTVTVGDESVQFASWGRQNDLPVIRQKLAMENGIASQLLETKRNLLLGNGLMLYKERFEQTKDGTRRIVDECPIPPIMSDWTEANEADEVNRTAARELILQGQYFIEHLHNLGGDCESVEQFECRFVRAEKLSQAAEKSPRSRIKNWLLAGDWSKRAKDIESVQNYNRRAKKKQTKYIRRFGDNMWGSLYYFSPTWWASRQWVRLANIIPKFHLKNIQNGYLIRYHVEFPKDYFIESKKPYAQLTPKEREEVKTKADERRTAFMRKINSILVGVENVGRTLFTSYEINRQLGKEFPGVKVTPITVDLKDKALLELFDKSNQATISSQGILPALSGIETQGKLSSGSEIRNALAFYLATKTPEPRRVLFAWLNAIGKTNGWFTGQYQGCQFGARDVIITTTDKEKKGKEDSKNV